MAAVDAASNAGRARRRRIASPSVPAVMAVARPVSRSRAVCHGPGTAPARPPGSFSGGVGGRGGQGRGPSADTRRGTPSPRSARDCRSRVGRSCRWSRRGRTRTPASAG